MFGHLHQVLADEGVRCDGDAVRGADRGARDVRIGARSGWALTRTWSIEGGLRTAWTNQTVFRGWQSEAFIGLRFGDAGAL